MAESGEKSKKTELEGKPLRIIHVENEKSFQGLVREELEKFPKDISLVGSFSSAEDAMSYLMKLKEEKKDLPDMIISDNDLGLGKMMGMQLAVNLKKEGFNISFVLLTAGGLTLERLPKEYPATLGITRIIDKKEVGSLVNILKETVVKT